MLKIIRVILVINILKYKVDKYMIGLILILFFISTFALYSADSINMNIDGIVTKQIMWYFFGFLILFSILYIGNKVITDNVSFLYIICNVFLLLLLLIGPVINNARCWFRIPGLGTIQVSEFAKIILILMFSKFLGKVRYKGNLKYELKIIGISLLLLFIPSVLTFLEPDTGAVLMYFIIVLSMLFFLQLRARWYILAILIVSSVVLFITYIYFNDIDLFVKILGNDFFLRIERLTSWVNKEGMQLENGITAIAIGGLMGTGFNNNSVYFPEAHTDFIFATIASNFGFIGSLFLIVILILFDLRLLYYISCTNKKSEKLIVIGVLSVLFYQQVQNIGMTFGLLPITGITLPFISYGGSSLISYMIMVGICMNIAKSKYKN
ncbi:MAG: FtsW/RodA/SpoVE family cell cycle protein [Bacilli bacterium]